jgi:hypothetical protein
MEKVSFLASSDFSTVLDLENVDVRRLCFPLIEKEEQCF